jgi:shikimate kinase
MKNIYLVGFMATGKSSVGRELAERQNFQFVDLDNLIELKEIKRISDIFAKDGEPYFRKVEKEVLEDTAKKNKFVVACGGGIVINPENIRIMKETGLLICLGAKPEVILKRASGSKQRPLLNVADPKKQIELLLEERSSYYALADKIIDTSELSVKEVVDKISDLILKEK